VTADIPEIVRVVNLAYRVEDFFINGDRTSPEDTAARLQRVGSDVLVIEGAQPGTLAAVIYLERRGDRLWFGLLSVDPAARGQGHARQLIGAVEMRCRAAGLALLEIDVVDLRTELPAFYHRLGFREVGTRPFPDPGKLRRPAHMVVMQKALT
jgi:GNAT superfamily N-acetyltransferase